ASLDELHGHPRDAVALADVVNGDDGRMVERRGGAGFRFESTAAGLAIDQPLGNHLQRYRAAEPRVEAAVDLAHAARPDERIEPIRAQLPADKRGGHRGEEYSRPFDGTTFSAAPASGASTGSRGLLFQPVHIDAKLLHP